MADIAVTAANVALVSGPRIEGVAGAAILAGQIVYRKASDQKWYLAQRDGTAEEGGYAGVGTGIGDLGFALNSAPGAGQPLDIAGPGADVTCGGTIVIGTIYTLSDTAGGFTTDAQSSGDYNGVVGIGKSTTRMRLILQAGEAAV